MDKIEELLTRGVANIIPDKSALEKVLKSGKKLNVYLGIDPTAAQIHLGHAVPLRKLQAFANLGHNVTLLIGDFTALIGDTSDKDAERPVLTSEEIAENFKTYKEQAEKILDFSKIKIRYNSEWLKKLGFTDILKLTQRFSANDFVSRELIRKRLNEGKRIGLHEVLYPVMQGYDSYFMDTDVQIGGTDQTFNMQAGRTLQKDLRKKESFVMSNVFLGGTDGRKMSKTWGNAIWLNDDADDMYAKIMSIKDDLIIQYFTLATNTSLKKIDEIETKLKNGENPMQIKKELALEIVGELYSREQAKKAAENFTKVIQQKETPDVIPVFDLTKASTGNPTMSDVLTTSGLATSKSEAKRLIEQGGVSIDGQTVKEDVPFKTDRESLLKVGKRRFVRVKTA